MRTHPHFAHGFGASPASEPEHAMDQFTAQGILTVAHEIRAASAVLADYAAKRLSQHDLWAADLDGRDPAVKRERLAAALDELLDDFMHQGKLEDAGEIA